MSDEEILPGQLLFDAKGRCVGIVALVSDAELLVQRRGVIRLPSGRVEAGIEAILGKPARPHPPADLEPLDISEEWRG
jgi:hypothetical protein